MSAPETQIDSLDAYVSGACNHFKRFHRSKCFFFRGHRSASYKLLPTVYRDDYPESEFSHQFRAMASIAEGVPTHNDLDRWLFIMQHHGLPTRLLDWTESPLVALHFALHQNHSKDDASVTVLNPTGLNKHVLGNLWFPDRNDPTYKYRFLKAFYTRPETLPWPSDFNIDGVNERMLPLAVRPITTHQRMISQRAAFTIHGDDHRDIETIFEEHKLKNLIHRFIIKHGSKRAMEVDLKNLGITRSVIFPDFGGVAEDIVSRRKKEMTVLTNMD